jgi:hypothetical protein
MLSVEWGFLKSVTYQGRFLHTMLVLFVMVIAIGSETYAKGSHALCYFGSFNALWVKEGLSPGETLIVGSSAWLLRMRGIPESV